MKAKKFGIALLVLGLIVASFVLAEMKDELILWNVSAVPLGGNILYVGGSGPNNYTSIQDAIDDANPSYVQGIDVSHWEGDINWSEVYGAGYKFAFVKASEGVGWTDSNFVTNMNNGSDAGLLMGAYHFARPDLGNNAVDEALYFVGVARNYLKGGYLRPALDLEVGSSLGKEALSNWVHTWMNTVKNETGIEPIIYVNSNYANNYLNTSVAEYDLWIAHWTYDPSTLPNTGIWDSWDFWQYSNKGSIPGISGDVDLDLFNGDMDRLCKTFLISNPPAPSTSIIKPRGHLYINDREIIPLPRNITVIIGKITIEAYAQSFVGIEKVEFYIDGKLKAVVDHLPYQWLWDEKALCMHTIKVIACDKAGNTATDEQTVWIFNL